MDLNDERWRKPGETPEISAGSMREFIIAVKRARNGKVYSFGATYLNAYPLNYEDCPKGRDALERCEGCDDGCPTTGWFGVEGNDDGEHFQTLYMDKGDEFLGWRNVPQWPESRS